MARLQKYSLPKNEQALVHVTSIDVKTRELTIADMWRVPNGSDTKEWKNEIDRQREALHMYVGPKLFRSHR